MTIVRYVCRLDNPCTQARHLPSSYTVVVHVRGIVNVVEQVSDAHRCASVRVDVLTVMPGEIQVIMKA